MARYLFQSSAWKNVRKNQVPHKEQTPKIMDFDGGRANQINEMKTSI